MVNGFSPDTHIDPAEGCTSAVEDEDGACPWCSGGGTVTYHAGPCPRVKAIDFYLDGSVRRVELVPLDDGAPR